MKIRIKMHQMPGDISKQEKASILENSYHCDDVELKERRSLINLYRMRERAVFKEETRKEMKYSEE
jgi:hypothetical protein